MEILGVLLAIGAFILGSVITMMIVNVIYDAFSAVIPIIAIILITIGIIIGLVVAIRNTVTAFRTVYARKGKKKHD